jgi:hypothetical protein
VGAAKRSGSLADRIARARQRAQDVATIRAEMQAALDRARWARSAADAEAALVAALRHRRRFWQARREA